MLDFHGLITSYVAYFSTWQPHENRVSKTWFITLINNRDHSQNISNQRRTQKKKKNKKKKREEPRQHGGAQPRPGHVVRGDPGQVACDQSGFFFFFFFSGFSDMFWASLLSESLDSFIFFVYFRLYERLETYIFLKFFWLVNRALEARFPGRKLMPHQTMEIEHLTIDL